MNVLTGMILLIWYGSWISGGVLLAMLSADPEGMEKIGQRLVPGLFILAVLWQVWPLMTVTSGVSLDLSRLTIYPVRYSELFLMESVLRLSTATELIIPLAGLAAGMALNPRLLWWAPLPLLPFAVFNLLLSAGFRDLFARLSARRYARELAVLSLVLAAAAPQLLIRSEVVDTVGAAAQSGFGWWWPWSLTARLLTGSQEMRAAVVLVAWTAVATLFGWRQFERSLRSPLRASGSGRRQIGRRNTGGHWLHSWLPRDPLGVIFEFEVRRMARSPRFRLVFFMGFTFGLILWLPMLLRRDASENLLTIVSVYSLMLIGEACFWNILGMDRSGVQMWFSTPVLFSSVLTAKNAASALYVALEVAAVCIVCFVAGVPVSSSGIGEAFAVTGVLALFLFTVGNVFSVSYPRPTDPMDSWARAGSGRVQALLLLIYPVAGLPVLFAYWARSALGGHFAFYTVLAMSAAIGTVAWRCSLRYASKKAFLRREVIVQQLSRSAGPLA